MKSFVKFHPRDRLRLSHKLEFSLGWGSLKQLVTTSNATYYTGDHTSNATYYTGDHTSLLFVHLFDPILNKTTQHVSDRPLN